MRLQDVVYFMFLLILVYLIATHGTAVNALLTTSTRGLNTLVRSLQGR